MNGPAPSGPGFSAPVPTRVRDLALRLAGQGALPAYVWDLDGLAARAGRIRAALPPAVEVFYAAKANPDAGVLRTLAGADGALDGVEVASAGELAHVRSVLPDARTAFGGPGKTPQDLEAALLHGVERIHVESPHELRMLAVTAERVGATVDVLLRANPPRPPGPARGLRAVTAVPEVLAMGGGPSQFGMDEPGLIECLAILDDAPRLRLRGVHAHLTSGLGATDLAGVAAAVLRWASAWAARHQVWLEECNLGGGMGVDYSQPAAGFDWQRYGEALHELTVAHPGVALRIEPGRAVAAYDGYYLTRVLDVKDSQDEAFAVLAGGTHHLRTPAAKGHDQPFVVVDVDTWPWDCPRPGVSDRPVTLVGQLCTPKDVLARNVPISQLRAGDLVVFALAGAYGWNISHRDFLMHPPPTFHQLGRQVG